MIVEPIDGYAHRVLATVSQLTSGGAAGTSLLQVRTALASDSGRSAPDAELTLVLAQLRSNGLLMSNPTGEVRVTSAGQHWLAEPPQGTNETPAR